MRIVHVIDYFHTDVGYQEYFLARDMARAGHTVTVIASDHRQHTVAEPGPDEELGRQELADAGVALVRLPARQLGHDRAWLRGLGAALREARPDVAHVHGPFSPTTVRAVRACCRLGAAVLVDNHIHEAIAPGSTSPVNRAVYGTYRALAGPGMRRAVGCWVANGPHEADFLSTRLGIDRADVALVPLGFDPDVFRWDPARRAAARALLGSNPDEVVVAVTGKIHPGKRPEAVAAAAEAIATGSGARPARLVLAGTVEPGSAAAVRAAAPTLAASGRIVERGLLGRHDLADLYLAADAVVFARLPSISIYEAAGTGARVLVGADAFSRWLHGLCPSIEPVGVDPLDLSGLGDTDTARAEQATAADAAFSWPRVADRFVDRYQALLTDPRPGGAAP